MTIHNFIGRPCARFFRVGGLALGISLPAFAQLASPPVTPATTTVPPKPVDDKVIELSPFAVTSDDDVGYQATNTTSGSRLSTALKDTPASISPFTPEFLSDIAATNVNEMLAYAANAELTAGDSEGVGFSNPRDISSAGGEPFRIRGIPGGVSTDYVENSAPQDLYNIERAEVASGPNSILFGSGDAGGLVSLSSKKAKIARTKYSGQAMFGSWGYERYTTDLNQVLIPKTLAFRFNGLYSNARTWRLYEFNDAKRYSAALTYKPFKNTIVAANYENGLVANSVGVKWNTTDQVTSWIAAGRPVTDTIDAARGVTGYGALGVLSANQRFTYYAQDGFVSNLRNKLRTNIAPGIADTLLPASIFPYDVNWAGPQTKLTRDFSNYQISIEQRMTDALTVQGIYLKNKTNAIARTFVYSGNVMDFMGDPNLTIPAPSGTGTIINPRAKQLFIESNQNDDRTETKNEIKRVTVAYEFKLGKWLGNHRMAALGEHAVKDNHTRARREILVDEANRPLAGASGVAAALTDPANTQNLLYRRNYVTEGSNDTYALNNLYTPLAPFTYNGLSVHSRLVNTGEQSSIKDTRSLMFAMQSSWFEHRLNTTLGYRKDNIIYQDDNAARITNPADPRVASGDKVLNELVAVPGFTRHDVHPKTVTLGGVYHFNQRFSVFYNHSTNVGAPRFLRTLLPKGELPDTPKGKGRDLGVMIDLFGDDRYFARITYFETSQIGDAAVSPSGQVLNATALGRSQTLAILAAFLAAGKMTQAEVDAQSFNWNAATIDTASKGVELELVANPTRNWTIRANYSYSSRDREKFFAEGYAFFGGKFPEWRALAAGSPALLATIETNITTIQTNELDGRAVAQEQGFGSIPHKATLTTRYKFSGGSAFSDRLKGAFVGGGVRYQSKDFSSTDTRAPSAGGTGKDYYANMTLMADVFAGYRFRSPWLKLPVSLQLNVKNLTNSYLNTTARWNVDYSGARRVYLRDPRSFRLTASVEY